MEKEHTEIVTDENNIMIISGREKKREISFRNWKLVAWVRITCTNSIRKISSGPSYYRECEILDYSAFLFYIQIFFLIIVFSFTFLEI